jgi:two-component system response regulator (stage 0 sporulation protein A)
MIRVLIVDDDTRLAECLRDYLNILPDMEVVAVANNGLEALRRIRKLQPDVVLLDITMPLLDGVGVLEQLSEDERKKTNIIIHSALATDDIQQRLITLGAKYFPVKPCDFQMTAERIRQLTTDAAH